MSRRTRGFPLRQDVTCVHRRLRTQKTSGLSGPASAAKTRSSALEHVVERRLGVRPVDRPVEELVAARHRDQHAASPVVLAPENCSIVSASSRPRLAVKNGVAGDGRVPAAARVADLLRAHPVAVQQRREVLACAVEELAERAVRLECFACRRGHGVRQVDREHLQETRCDDAGVRDRVRVGHRRRLGKPQVEAGLELLLRELREVAGRCRHEPDVIVDQIGPVVGRRAHAEEAEVEEAERRPAAILDMVGVDGDVAAGACEGPLHQPAELPRLCDGEVREVLVALSRRASIEETHGGVRTLPGLTPVANASSE